MVTRVPAEPTVLEWAREASGLTIDAAAELLGCKPELLTDIEKGIKQPSVSMFRDMASCYGFPEATLLAAVPPELPKFPKDHRTFDGIPPQLSHRTILAIRRVQGRQECLQELAELDQTVVPPEPRHYQLNHDPELVAASERNLFGLTVSDQLKASTEKLLMMLRLRIEALGISVYVEDFPVEDSRGVSLFVDQFPAIILSGNEKRKAWQLFSLLHEYAHILIRDPGISDQRRNTRDPAEAFCNKFAAAFLMPRAAVERVLHTSNGKQNYSLAVLEEASDRLGVSISALALRVEDLGYVSEGFYSRVRAVIRPPPVRTAKPAKVPRQYVVLNQLGHRFTSDVLKSVENGVLTKLEASRMLRTNTTLLPALEKTIEGRRRAYLHGGAEG